MSTNTLGLFLRHLALSEEVSRLGTTSDHDLLAAYEEERGEAAFTELMRRHGPMVLRTCYRILGQGPDAEDAFQATFLSLSRRAGQLAREAAGPLSLGGWLHRVAYRIAANASAEVKRRRNLERQASVTTYSNPDPVTRATWNEIRPILDAELDALPEQARRLLITCYLQGKTYTEAAAELGLPRGSMAWRLEKARSLLAERLARRGITVPALLLTVLLGETAKGAGVPAVLLVHTIEAARTFAGQAVGVLSENVARLVKGGLANMSKGWTHWSMALMGWVSLLGAGLLACQTLKAWPDQKPEGEPPATAERPAQEKAKTARTDRYGDPLPPGALARLGTMRLRHGACPRSVSFTRDGKGVVTAERDLFPRLWDVATGKLLREFDHIPKPQYIGGEAGVFVFGAVLSPDGRILAVRGGLTGSLYLLETATGKLLREFKSKEMGPGIKSSMNFAFSPDSKVIAAQLDDGFVLWEVATGRERWRREEQGDRDPAIYPIALAFSPDGKTLASADGCHGIRLWDAQTGKQLRELGHKGRQVKHIVFSPDGRTLAVNGSTPEQKHWTVQLWEVGTGREVRTLEEPDKEEHIDYPVFSPDGKTVATCGSEGLCLWEVATGKKLRRCKDCRYLACFWQHPPAFSPDGKLLAMVDGGPVLRFWDAASGEALPLRVLQVHEDGVNSVAFTPDSQTLVSAGRDQTVRWWDTRTGRERFSLRCCNNPLGHGIFTKAVLSPDGKLVAASCVDVPNGAPRGSSWFDLGRSGIRIYDAATGKELRRLDSGKGNLTVHLTFSPDGKWLAEDVWYRRVGGPVASSGSRAVQLLEVATGKRHKCWFDESGMAVFSPNGTILAAVGNNSGDRIRFLEVATGNAVYSVFPDETILDNRNIRCLALSPDGRMLAIVGKKIALYPVSWDKQAGVHLGEPRLVASPSSPCPILAFSPDGRMLASAEEGQGSSTVHVWEVASGKERTCFAGHINEVTALAFSADGRRLASGSTDTTTLIWNVTDWVQDEAIRSTKFADKALEGRWTDLAGTDAARAGRAVWALVAAGPQAVSLLGERLRPTAAKASSEVMTRLIADLDSENFKTRQKAKHELEKLGEECEAALRQALAKQPSVEMRRSLKEFLSKLEEAWKTPSGDVLRGVRAVEVLEQVGTPHARRVLEGLSRGAPGANLTREAQVALGRLNRKQPE